MMNQDRFVIQRSYTLFQLSREQFVTYDMTDASREYLGSLSPRSLSNEGKELR